MENKKRLVDANKLIDFIDVGHLRHPGELCYSEVDVANILLHAPTVDAVPVVRCLDCKHMSVLNCEILYAYCPKTNTVFMPFELDAREHFCSLGERKDGDD